MITLSLSSLMWEYSLVTGINSPIICNYNCMYTQSKNSHVLVYSPVSCLSVNKNIDLCHQFEIDGFVLSMIIDLILITHKLICYTCSGVVT